MSARKVVMKIVGISSSMKTRYPNSYARLPSFDTTKRTRTKTIMEKLMPTIFMTTFLALISPSFAEAHYWSKPTSKSICSMMVFVLVLFVVSKLGSRAYEFGYRVFMEEPMDTENGEDVIIRIREGMEGAEIAALLERRGLIRDAGLFVVQLKIAGGENKIRAGSYTLNTMMTAREMIQVLSAQEETEGEKGGS